MILILLLIFISLAVSFLQPTPDELYFIFISFISTCFFYRNFIVCFLTYGLAHKKNMYFIEFMFRVAERLPEIL